MTKCDLRSLHRRTEDSTWVVREYKPSCGSIRSSRKIQQKISNGVTGQTNENGDMKTQYSSSLCILSLLPLDLMRCQFLLFSTLLFSPPRALNLTSKYNTPAFIMSDAISCQRVITVACNCNKHGYNVVKSNWVTDHGISRSNRPTDIKICISVPVVS